MISDRELISKLHGAARHLFEDFASFTDVQRNAIPLILKGIPVFLIAPTASGKTEAAISPLLENRAKERWNGKPSILYVVPTRALVNDLHRRLEPRLSKYLSVGRRTGEYREPDSDLLLTTPESFDSMLARGGSGGSHILRDVRAVVMDEIHLLCESARGTQLQFLLERLDNITEVKSYRVALSATIANAEELAFRYLGVDAKVISLGGGRSFKVDRVTGTGPLPGRPMGIVDPLAYELWCVRGKHPVTIPERLLALRKTQPLKALVFVASRARCDTLASEISRYFRGRCPVPVVAHHGSLSKYTREKAEETLLNSAESVAVATATLELGIDIGDVNLVVLDGPPGSVSSFLQRVGRANRRESTVHIIPVSHDIAQACIFASMIRSAMQGELDAPSSIAHYSVLIQQLASMLFQSSTGRLNVLTIKRMLASVFGESVDSMLKNLVDSSYIREISGSVIGPSEYLCELMENPLKLHANIGGDGNVVPLIDSVTGEPMAWVQRPKINERVILGGSSYKVMKTLDAYELKGKIKGGIGRKLHYSRRKVPITRNALRHLCLGLGFPDNTIIKYETSWIHFGGVIYQKLLQYSGIESNEIVSNEDPRIALSVDSNKILEHNWKIFEKLCGFGPYHLYLHPLDRKKAVIKSISISDYKDWLESLVVRDINDEIKSILNLNC